MNWLTDNGTLWAAVGVGSLWLWRYMLHGWKLGRLAQELDDHVVATQREFKYIREDLRYLRNRADTEALRRMES